jgi:uridylate kinase
VPAAPQFGRVLLKVSGEALAGQEGSGLNPQVLDYMAGEVKKVHDLGVQVAMVVGGGNFIRGAAFSREGGIERTVADQMGMLATIMNGLALQAAIESQGVPTRVQSALAISAVCEPFIRRRAIRHMEKGRVVVFVAGTGNPYFSTDSASVLRGLEIEADALIKATKVDGIYDKDPHKHSDAVRFDSLTFQEAIERNLAVMDQTAFTLCRGQGMPIIVLDLNEPGAMARAILGEAVGTRVEGS